VPSPMPMSMTWAKTKPLSLLFSIINLASSNV
jgi:hypothetical protein